MTKPFTAPNERIADVVEASGEVWERKDQPAQTWDAIDRHKAAHELAVLIANDAAREERVHEFIDRVETRILASWKAIEPVITIGTVWKTTVVGVGPWCVEFPDGEIISCRTRERAVKIAKCI